MNFLVLIKVGHFLLHYHTLVFKGLVMYEEKYPTSILFDFLHAIKTQNHLPSNFVLFALHLRLTYNQTQTVYFFSEMHNQLKQAPVYAMFRKDKTRLIVMI